MFTIVIIRNPHNSSGNYLGPLFRASCKEESWPSSVPTRPCAWLQVSGLWVWFKFEEFRGLGV